MPDSTEGFEVFQTQRMLGLGQGYAIIAMRPLPSKTVFLEEYVFFPALEDVEDYAHQRKCSEATVAHDSGLFPASLASEASLAQKIPRAAFCHAGCGRGYRVWRILFRFISWRVREADERF